MMVIVARGTKKSCWQGSSPDKCGIRNLGNRCSLVRLVDEAKFEPGAVGWKARMLPLCHEVHQFIKKFESWVISIVPLAWIFQACSNPKRTTPCLRSCTSWRTRGVPSTGPGPTSRWSRTTPCMKLTSSRAQKWPSMRGESYLESYVTWVSFLKF